MGHEEEEAAAAALVLEVGTTATEVLEGLTTTEVLEGLTLDLIEVTNDEGVGMTAVDEAAITVVLPPVTNMFPVGKAALVEVELALALTPSSSSPSHSSAVVNWKISILKFSPHVSLESPAQGMLHSESSTY